MDDAVNRQDKRRLKRIVSMLTKLAQRGESIAASSPPRDAEVEYEYEHECEATAQPVQADQLEMAESIDYNASGQAIPAATAAYLKPADAPKRRIARVGPGSSLAAAA